MVKSKIGILLRSSKYKREFIQKELGITANTLSNWSTGKTYPTIDKAYELAKLLDVNITDLYQWGNQEE
jgi:transcriptional regulator with XRE-family HTH domain